MKYIIPIILLAAGFFAYQFFADNEQDYVSDVVAQSLEIQEESENYSIDISIAPTGFTKLDSTIALENEIDVVEFKLLARASSTSTTTQGTYELQKSSEKYQSSNILKLETLVVTEYQYTGGAHGNTTFQTYTYSTETGLQYNLDNIISQSPELNTFLANTIVNAITEKEPNADQQWIRDAVADWSNLQNFYIQDDVIHFIFAPYIVSPYAMGAQKVSIDMEELLPFVRGSVKKAYGLDTTQSATTVETTTTQ